MLVQDAHDAGDRRAVILVLDEIADLLIFYEKIGKSTLNSSSSMLTN